MYCKKCYKNLTYQDLLFWPYNLCEKCRQSTEKLTLKGINSINARKNEH